MPIDTETSSCRECCERLTAARQVLAGPSGTTASSSKLSPEYKLAAQRVERCLSILERFAEQCQVHIILIHVLQGRAKVQHSCEQVLSVPYACDQRLLVWLSRPG